MLFLEFALCTDMSAFHNYPSRLLEQAALHGVLAKIRDLDLELVSVNRVEAAKAN